MEDFTIDKSIFKFQYLPDYASYLLNNKLEEYVTVGIRFCREADLPLFRPLASLKEKDLVEMSMESNRQILTALAKNEIGNFIETGIQQWINNKITDPLEKDIIERLVPEDLALGFYLRRKLFSFFLHGYTKNAVVHMLIAGEVDFYTSQEEVISLKAYLAIQKEQALKQKSTEKSLS